MLMLVYSIDNQSPSTTTASTNTTPEVLHHNHQPNHIESNHLPTPKPRVSLAQNNTGQSARSADSRVASIAMLEQEVLYLRQELSGAREQIRRLQEQEKQLRDR